MSELKGACIFGQSGGPTSVINASAYGVIRTALENPNITRVLGAEHGIKGVLNDRLFDMGEEDPAELELLKYTPSSALGSCRYKMKDPDVDDTDCPEVIAVKPSPKTIRTALADFIRRFLTPYKCEGRQGVYIDKELHQKISVIVGIAGKRQLTVGNYIDNVLKEHFEKHSEEVKTYLQKSYNKIF